MNGEEEGVTEATHPPLLIAEDQPPAEAILECESRNESEVKGDDQVVAADDKGEDEVFLEVDGEKKDGLIGGVEDSTVAEKDGGVGEEESIPAGDEGGELMREGVSMEELSTGEEPVAVKEASFEVEGQIAVVIEKLEEEPSEVQQSCPIGEEEEKLNGGDTEQDDESNFGEETAQVDENREVEEADAQYNDDALLPLPLHDGDMMMEEGKAGDLDTEIKGLEDSKIELEEMKRELNEEEDEKQIELEEDREIKIEAMEGKEVEKVTEVEANKEEEPEVEESKEEKLEDNETQADVREDLEMEKVTEEEEKEVKKITEEEEKQEVETTTEKETDGEKRQSDAKDDDEILVGEENEVEKETEEDEEANKGTEMEEDEEMHEVEKKEVEKVTEVEVNKENEILVGEENEVEKETEEDEEANKGTEMEEDEEMHEVEKKEVEKVTEVEVNKENEILAGEENEVEKETEEDEEANKGTEMEEDEEMHEVEEKEVDKVTEVEVNKENEMEDEERRADTMEHEEMEDEEEREVEDDANKETEDEEEREVDADEEKEMEDDERLQSPKGGSVKRNRGRNLKVAGRAPSKKTAREDVCFICHDDGELVFCDRRGCHKGYHLSCAEHDKSFNQTNGRWNCGWHLCNFCKKAACFMCYTCQFALCKGCAKSDAIFISVRGNKGLCETCMGSVMLIETNEENDGMDEATVDDRSRKNNLFKDYWTEQKERLSLTLDEIAQAKSRWMKEMPTEILVGNPNGGIASEIHLGSAESTDSKKNKSKKRVRPSTKEVDYDEDYSSGSAAKKKGKKGLKSLPKEDNDSDNSSKDNVVTRARKAKKSSKAHVYEVDSASPSGAEWASKELLEFVMHMKDGDRSPLSQYDVQELLLEYIQRNKLRDPRRKSQIICDAMLQRLFGKQRVGHFEMLKLLELHFLLKEDSQADDNHGSVVDAEGSQLDVDENADSVVDLGKNKGRKSRRKGDGRGLQSNLDDYAAIDTHNITLIYLRRNLIEALLEDTEGFHDKVVGAFVRIRISGSNQKNDIYRLVQVTGTNKAEPYKVGKRIAYCMLEILNLNKTEVVSIDTISNQDFTEDECKRLRQSIKCGLISRLTVGDVLDKAKDLQVVRVIDWLETESTRLNHLRDRASDLGRKKELRECVEKLQLLSTAEERQRRLDEIPEVHADPNMDPSHESEEESEPEEKRQEINVRPRETPFQWRERDHFPSRKGDYTSADPWSPTERPPARNWESGRSLSGKGFSSRFEDTSAPEEAFYGNPWSPVRDKVTSPDSSRGKSGQYSEMRNNASASALSDTSRNPSASVAQTPAKISDSDKLWHYKDPTGKDQGPFSVNQLRKWNKSGYFPATLHIWKTGQTEEDAIFLTEALAGRFEKLPSKMLRSANQTYRGQPPAMLKVDHNNSSTRDTFDQMSPVMHRSRSDSTSSKGLSSPNLSSTPPPSQRSGSSWSGGRSKVSRWSGSPTPVQQPPSNPLQMLPSPTPSNNGGFSRSHLGQQSIREDDRFTEQLQPQPIMLQQQPPPPQPITETITAVQPGGYMQNPTQAQYGQGWANAPPPNNLPPPPPPPPPSYPQTPWTTQQAPPATQPNVQWAPPMQQAWAPPMQQANPNLGWGAPFAPLPPANVIQAPGQNMNMGWQSGGNMNPGWGPPPPANTGGPGPGPGPWNWQQQQQQAAHGGGAGGNMGPPGRPVRRKSNMPCPYFMQGHCKKGASCDYRHS